MTIAVLSDYAARRDAHLGTQRRPYFFVAEQAADCCINTCTACSGGLSRQIGLRQEGNRGGPRIHDRRHRFAVRP